MTKKMFAIYFGLVILSLSLFASTAFAANPAGPGTTQVVVTNSPAQPVPMVGVIKDSDAPARKPFQWNGTAAMGVLENKTLTATTVPSNQRLVIERVSGYCQGMTGLAKLHQYKQGVPDLDQWLPAEFANGSIFPAAASVSFYVEPDAAFQLVLANFSNSQQYTCYMSATGYFVNLP